MQKSRLGPSPREPVPVRSKSASAKVRQRGLTLPRSSGRSATDSPLRQRPSPAIPPLRCARRQARATSSFTALKRPSGVARFKRSHSLQADRARERPKIGRSRALALESLPPIHRLWGRCLDVRSAAIVGSTSVHLSAVRITPSAPSVRAVHVIDSLGGTG